MIVNLHPLDAIGLLVLTVLAALAFAWWPWKEIE